MCVPPPWSPGRGAGQQVRPSLTCLTLDGLDGCSRGQALCAPCRPWEVLHAHRAQPLQVSVLTSPVRRSSCFPSSRLHAQSCSQFFVSLHSNPQGRFSHRAPQMQGAGTPTLASISKEEPLGRVSLAQRRERKVGHPDLGKHGKQASPGLREQRLGIYLRSTPTSFLPLLVCSKFKFPRSN